MLSLVRKWPLDFTFSFDEMRHCSVNNHPQRPHIGAHHLVKILNSAVHESLSEKYSGIVHLQNNVSFPQREIKILVIQLAHFIFKGK